MALWGDQEVTGSNTGTIEIHGANGLVEGTSTEFDAELSVGNFIRANGIEHRVISVTSNTAAHVEAAQKGGTVANVAAGNTYTVSTKPIYTSAVSDVVSADDVYFIDTTENAVTANRAKGLRNGGWTHYTTYTDTDGATRHKAEVLVAMRRTAAAAGDAEDTVAADS